MATRTLKRVQVTVNHSIGGGGGDETLDVFQVPSGAIWLVNRLTRQNLGVDADATFLNTLRTNSGATFVVTLDQDTAPSSADAEAVQVPNIQGGVMSDQDKIRSFFSATNTAVAAINYIIDVLEIVP